MLKATATSYVWRQVKGNQRRENAEWCICEATLIFRDILQKTTRYPSLVQVWEAICLLSWVTESFLPRLYITLLNQPSHTVFESAFLSSGIYSLSLGGNCLFLKIMLNLALGQCYVKDSGEPKGQGRKCQGGNALESPWSQACSLFSMIQAYGYFPFFLHCALFGPRNMPFGGRLGGPTQSSQWLPLCKTSESRGQNPHTEDLQSESRSFCSPTPPQRKHVEETK